MRLRAVLSPNTSATHGMQECVFELCSVPATQLPLPHTRLKDVQKALRAASTIE